ncbi:MAG: hypothetical protein JNN01_19315 [Opitutaceae bacterium]|nr:hypothetical protein [Opitutaceae bacterium]
MKKLPFSAAVAKSRRIRAIYHQLELKHHGSEWTIEEDALAFLTDAALVGRLAMAQQGRWPLGKDPAEDLQLKLGECMWWLIALAARMEIDSEEALDSFLAKTERQLSESLRTIAPRTRAKRLKRKHSL